MNQNDNLQLQSPISKSDAIDILTHVFSNEISSDEFKHEYANELRIKTVALFQLLLMQFNS